LALFLPLSHSFSGKWDIYEGGAPTASAKEKEELWRSTGSWTTGNHIPLYSFHCLTPDLNKHLFWKQYSWKKRISNYYFEVSA